ncbi:M15 family metallopeptidase [Niallia nealsonii]|uniref:Peptidase M15C domain-containing protein n=1 Tax=Niallia nealsonii TaxID=115979 RepID=A0A2N0Z4D8_9BACI|nr:M15 family metallopeptidase [Niallia nealsonii]PKG24391.1 hypothetical protein CWS01_07200 [Niallia nealsonii]
MAFTPYYHERNLKNLAQLGDNTKKKAIEWYKYLIENEINVLIYETTRSVETQRENVAKGASQTMKSYHLEGIGQALDFVMVDTKGNALWNGYGSAEAKKAIAKAKALGFEWGGDWTTLVDKPHLEYHYKGYGTDTFKTKGDAISLTVEKSTITTKTVTEKSKNPSVVYEAHVQGIGWQGKKKDGQTAGTTGKSQRLEALTVKLENSNAELEMQGHVQGIGWTTVRTNGEVIGTIGESLRLEAIKLKASGLTIQYRVHVEKDGWTAWKKNGEIAGTTGLKKGIEAIQIKLS